MVKLSEYMKLMFEENKYWLIKLGFYVITFAGNAKSFATAFLVVFLFLLLVADFWTDKFFWIWITIHYLGCTWPRSNFSLDTLTNGSMNVVSINTQDACGHDWVCASSENIVTAELSKHGEAINVFHGVNIGLDKDHPQYWK